MAAAAAAASDDGGGGGGGPAPPPSPLRRSEIDPGDKLDWVRACELLSEEDAAKGVKPHLYKEGIEPADLCQGAVGDCCRGLLRASDGPGGQG